MIQSLSMEPLRHRFLMVFAPLALALAIVQFKGPPLVIPAAWVFFTLFLWWWHLKLLPWVETHPHWKGREEDALFFLPKATHMGKEGRVYLHHQDLYSLAWYVLAWFPFGGAFFAVFLVCLHRLKVRQSLGMTRQEALGELGGQGLMAVLGVALGQWLIQAFYFGFTILCDTNPAFCGIK